MMQNSKARLFFSLLIYTLIVILWGAWVRISHSGDGCGDTWPLCNGQLIPVAQQGKTWIEYAHRAMSGLYGLVVFYLFIRHRKDPHAPFRAAVFWLFILTVTEALLGAKLVLFKLVGSNDTVFRLFAMGLHQFNSMLLVGANALAYFLADGREIRKRSEFSRSTIYLAVVVLLGITGSWAALSNTLFPSQDLISGILQDFDSQSHYLLRIRIIHPVMAVGTLLLLFYTFIDNKKLGVLFGSGLILGALTLLLHAPTPLKLAHLAMAHLIWVVLLFKLTTTQSKRA